MEQRYGAWAGLMSLCRLVVAGGGATTGYLPARKGQLFEPGAYPWLETPWISDGVVLSVLSNLLVVKGERISYRALDVEQIGSVYEGIMGYAVRRIPGRCIGLKSKPQGAKKQITTAVDLDALLELTGGKRRAWLEEQTGTTLPPKAATALKDAASEAELLEALAPRIDQALFDGPQTAGGLVFQPTEERRRSGSHYTPRALTRPIVEEALRPWLERCHHQPNAEQILALKICDPAMGSGAFLVESCRYLAELLEQAWNREGLPEALKPGGQAHGEDPLLYARRLIAQSCLYGVDKNPFAVNLARLSLWLVSLSKDAPFTFVDHALKCGDSLVGIERAEIEKALKGASRQGDLQMAYLDQVRQQEAKSFATFHADSRNDADDDRKRQALEDLNGSTAYLRTVGDLLVAAFFNGKKPKDRDELKQLYLAATLQHSSAEELEEELAEPLERLREGEKGIQPLHWQLAFPDVFGRDQPGFDVFVGNPPFAGHISLANAAHSEYTNWLRERHTDSQGKCDLVAHFFRHTFDLLRTNGSLGLIATNTIAQGDTRSSGLKWICLHGGTIYSAQKRLRWPGAAAVVVSVIHISKDDAPSLTVLDGMPKKLITAYLFDKGDSSDPQALLSNKKLSFQGSTILGMGFTFEDGSNSDTKTPGTPSPMWRMQEILTARPRSRDVLRPYIGGEEINASPQHKAHRFCIDFGESTEAEASAQWPELMQIARDKVRPARLLSAEKSNSSHGKRCLSYWQHYHRAKDLYAAISWLDEVVALSMVGNALAFARIPSNQVFANTVIVFALPPERGLPILQSRVHEIWARTFASTMKDDLRYSTADCFEAFPLPASLAGGSVIEQDLQAQRQSLGAIGERYHHARVELMVANNEGLTSTYNRFHDPAESSSGLLELRRLHGEMDQAVLAAYGWSDVLTDCGFGLDYLDLEDDAQLPDDLQERIDSGELFFWEPDEAGAFEAQVRAYGAVKGKKKFPWRYRWPDDVRDDVLARLLALNAERYAEEVALGLHGKGGKQAAKASKAAGASGAAATGKRRGRPPKSSQPGETEPTQTEQMGLGL
jgi:methylase of polypeptide subunit release factors